MTLLFFDGFQDGNVMIKPEWVGGLWQATTTGRDGSANGAVRMGSNPGWTYTLSSAAATCYVGIASMGNGTAYINGGSGNKLVQFIRSGTAECYLTINASGYLELRNAANAVLAVASHAPFQLNVWSHIQIKVVLSNTAGSCEVRLNGDVVLTYSGATATAAGSVTALNLQWGNNLVAFIDDLWVCDGVDATATQGRPNNTFLGDLGIKTLIPSADGDLNSWSRSTGTVGAALVDEVPPNTTDYVFSSTVGQQQLFQLSDLPAGAASVYGVRVNHYSLKTDTGASSVKPLLKEGGGTLTAQASLGLTTSAAGYSGAILFTKPSAPTAPWTVADVNALQVGVEAS